MSITAMKQALEAMKYADACLKKQLTTKTKHEYAQDLLMDAGVALRTAIEQAEKQPAQRQWVGLTEKDFSAINQSCLTKLQAATSAESILKEKNT